VNYIDGCNVNHTSRKTEERIGRWLSGRRVTIRNSFHNLSILFDERA
jgi:hypothetical protein